VATAQAGIRLSMGRQPGWMGGKHGSMGFGSAAGPPSNAEQEYRRVVFMDTVHDLLVSHGYWMTEDAWKKRSGRRTYIHDDNPSREYIMKLAKVLTSTGWELHPNLLRALRHESRRELLKLESGGPGTNGHFLHHMKMR